MSDTMSQAKRYMPNTTENNFVDYSREKILLQTIARHSSTHHIVSIIMQILLDLQWKILLGPDVAVPSYYMFQSIRYNLARQQDRFATHCKPLLLNCGFFNVKKSAFFRRDIQFLLER